MLSRCSCRHVHVVSKTVQRETIWNQTQLLWPRVGDRVICYPRPQSLYLRRERHRSQIFFVILHTNVPPVLYHCWSVAGRHPPQNISHQQWPEGLSLPELWSRAYFSVQLMTNCAVVTWKCAVVKVNLCSLRCT